MRALLDTNVLLPAHLRRLLVHTAGNGGFEAVWSGESVHELSLHLRDRQRLDHGAADEIIEKMRSNPDLTLVEGSGETLSISRVAVFDPKDAHLVAAAFDRRCDVLVTENHRHFRSALLGAVGLRIIGADQFMVDVFSDRATQPAVYRGMVGALGDLRNPPGVPRLINLYGGSSRLPLLAEQLRTDLRRGLPNVPFDQLQPGHLLQRARQLEARLLEEGGINR